MTTDCTHCARAVRSARYAEITKRGWSINFFRSRRLRWRVTDDNSGALIAEADDAEAAVDKALGLSRV